MALVVDLGQRLALADAQAALLVGGKAAGINVMSAQLGLPVPPAFALSTDVCREFLTVPKASLSAVVVAEVRDHVERLAARVGRRFADRDAPLLVSVRSGAPVSMPGMMDTILNLGLNEETTAGLARATGDPAFAADCLARFRMLFRSVVGVSDVPDDPWTQLQLAIEAVFRSWNSERARAFRAVESIDDDLGTAVVVQAMVFGNAGRESATGVVFTRDPSTGIPQLTGDVLFNAQGEDVVSGTHLTQPISALADSMPDVADELRRYAHTLEHHYRDMCDIEFTIERGQLWLLQTRVGKRSPLAAVRIARDMAEDATFPLSRSEAVQRVADVLAAPPVITTYDADAAGRIAKGVPASPGVACGHVAVDDSSVRSLVKGGRPAILVRSDTSPEDVPTMGRSAGVLTTRGGPASHAAVVARGWGIPAIVGASAITVGEDGIAIGDRWLPVGDMVTIDGSTGDVFAGEIHVATATYPEVSTLLSWASELGVQLPIAEPPRPAESAPPRVAAAEVDPPTDNEVDERDAIESSIVAVLSITAAATIGHLSAAHGLEVAHLASRVEALVDSGLVRAADAPVASTTLLRLTAAGAIRAEEMLAAAQERCGTERAEHALDDFIPLDLRMKAAVTDWQLRADSAGTVANDHTDPAYDGAVLSRLAELHDDVHLWLTPLRTVAPLLAHYLRRLDRAAQAISSGDGRFVASPRVDSYHSIWFELHEYLIRLSGRTREGESAVGRA